MCLCWVQPDHPGLSSYFLILYCITAAESLLPCKVTEPQFLVMRMAVFEGYFWLATPCTLLFPSSHHFLHPSLSAGELVSYFTENIEAFNGTRCHSSSQSSKHLPSLLSLLAHCSQSLLELWVSRGSLAPYLVSTFTTLI